MASSSTGFGSLPRRFRICGLAAVAACSLLGCVTPSAGAWTEAEYEALAATLEEDADSNSSAFADSAWDIEQHHPATGARVFEVRFYPNGVLENRHPNDRSPGNDRWRAEDERVTLLFNDSYAVYEGRMIEVGRVAGQARNRVGDVWDWSAVRAAGHDEEEVRVSQ